MPSKLPRSYFSTENLILEFSITYKNQNNIDCRILMVGVVMHILNLTVCECYMNTWTVVHKAMKTQHLHPLDSHFTDIWREWSIDSPCFDNKNIERGPTCFEIANHIRDIISFWQISYPSSVIGAVHTTFNLPFFTLPFFYHFRLCQNYYTHHVRDMGCKNQYERSLLYYLPPFGHLTMDPIWEVCLFLDENPYALKCHICFIINMTPYCSQW